MGLLAGAVTIIVVIWLVAKALDMTLDIDKFESTHKKERDKKK